MMQESNGLGAFLFAGYVVETPVNFLKILVNTD